MTTNANPAPPATPPADPIPDRITVHLTHVDLAPILSRIPAHLRYGFSFYGEVTANQYRDLTGDQDGRHLRQRIAVETESPEGGFGIIVHVCDILTAEQGSQAMQSHVISHLVRRDHQDPDHSYWPTAAPDGQEPETDDEWRAVARPLEQLSYRALQFLLHLADLYEPDPNYISAVNFDEALSNYAVKLTLADFVRPETMQ